MKFQLVCVLILCFLASQGQIDTTIINWHKIKFTHAKAYLYGIEKPADYIIKNGKLHPTVVDSAGIALNKHQISKVIQVAMGEIGEEYYPAFCFAPHHGIVFFDGKKPVSHISICFDCHQKRVVPTSINLKKLEENEMGKGLDILKQIVIELGLPVLKGEEEYYQYSEALKSKKN